jgi:hypothetical protein
MVLLGFRPKLFIYKLAGTPKQKGFRYWLKIKLEKRLYYSKVDLEYNKLVLQNNVENNGYFNSDQQLIPHVTAKNCPLSTVLKDNTT